MGECIHATAPPLPAAAILEEESPPEPAPEGVRPEEKPNGPLIRPEELIEQLSLGPPNPLFTPAAARAETRSDGGPSTVAPDVKPVSKADVVDLTRVHPHAVIAAACSSTGATYGSDSYMELDPSERSTDTGRVMATSRKKILMMTNG